MTVSFCDQQEQKGSVMVGERLGPAATCFSLTPATSTNPESEPQAPAFFLLA
jgi:hypothetical protein